MRSESQDDGQYPDEVGAHLLVLEELEDDVAEVLRTSALALDRGGGTRLDQTHFQVDFLLVLLIFTSRHALLGRRDALHAPPCLPLGPLLDRRRRALPTPSSIGAGAGDVDPAVRRSGVGGPIPYSRVALTLHELHGVLDLAKFLSEGLVRRTLVGVLSARLFQLSLNRGEL